MSAGVNAFRGSVRCSSAAAATAARRPRQGGPSLALAFRLHGQKPRPRTALSKLRASFRLVGCLTTLWYNKGHYRHPPPLSRLRTGTIRVQTLQLYSYSWAIGRLTSVAYNYRLLTQTRGADDYVDYANKIRLWEPDLCLNANQCM